MFAAVRKPIQQLKVSGQRSRQSVALTAVARALQNIGVAAALQNIVSR